MDAKATVDIANEPIAWWLVATFLTMLLILIGVLLKFMYTGIIKRLDAFDRTLGKILDFMAKQDEKNKKFEVLEGDLKEQDRKHTRELEKQMRIASQNIDKQTKDIWDELAKHDRKLEKYEEELNRVSSVQKACPHKPMI